MNANNYHAGKSAQLTIEQIFNIVVIKCEKKTIVTLNFGPHCMPYQTWVQIRPRSGEVPLNWDDSKFRQLVLEGKSISSEMLETSMRHH